MYNNTIAVGRPDTLYSLRQDVLEDTSLHYAHLSPLCRTLLSLKVHIITYFLFVLVICLLSLSTLFKEKCYYFEEDIYNTYRHSEIFINNSIRISFSQTSPLHLSCLGLCTHRKWSTKSGCNPSFRLSIILLLAGDVSIYPGTKTFQNMRFATTNVLSVRNKYAALSDLILSKHIDILALTETWLLASDTSACLADICPNGFCLYHHPRRSGRGGAVAFLVPEIYKVEIIHTPQYQIFEVICIVIKHSSLSANCICIYFNIYLDLPCSNTRSFMDVLQTHALHQHVSFPTHVHGHWLDLFITRSTCTNIKAIFPTDGLSDHHCVIIELWLQVGSRSRKKMITFRPINKININILHDDLANSDVLIKPKSTLCELVNQYNETLSKLLDKHAPKQTKSVQVRPPSPWMSNDIIVAKRRRRYLERIWRRTRSPIDQSRYNKQLHICNHMMSKAKSDYYTHFITTNSENPRQMWKSVNAILQRQKLKALPEHSSLDTLCSSFSKYFTDKIARIRNFFVINANDYDFAEPPLSEKTLHSFTPATNEVLIIIKKYPNKSCDIDPFPTLLLKSCIDQLIFPITTIINLSMQSGVVPQDFKQALVNPLIKKQTLCKNYLRNYRPISNLSFLSKILEKVVANRLHEHIYIHHLSNDLQSAYKRVHSTETALLKIHNDIADNTDNGKVTALTLLDLSDAFDTIDHSILLQRFHRYFGISGPALRWLKSFLSDRYRSINISGTLSCPQHLPFGVP